MIEELNELGLPLGTGKDYSLEDIDSLILNSMPNIPLFSGCVSAAGLEVGYEIEGITPLNASNVNELRELDEMFRLRIRASLRHFVRDVTRSRGVIGVPSNISNIERAR